MQAHWLEQNDDAITIDQLRAEGVHFEQLPTDRAGFQGSLDVLKKDKGYIEQDEVALSPATEGLEALCAKFIDEHFHDEDEVRFVLAGAGIFEIRSEQDRWMHLLVEQGDLIVVPAGRHHRFMLTESRNIRCLRLFKDSSGWTPHYRASP